MELKKPGRRGHYILSLSLSISEHGEQSQQSMSKLPTDPARIRNDAGIREEMRSSWEKSRIKGIQKQIYRKAHLAWNHRRQADPSSRKRLRLDLSSGRVDWEDPVSSARGRRKGAEEEGKWEGMEGDWSRGRRIHPTLSRTK